MKPTGYAAKILRVDMTNGKISDEVLSEETTRKFLGGVGIGAYYLYKEVPPQVNFDSPENLLIFSTGPLNGLRVAGCGCFNVTTKGALTNGASSSQANGFFGTYLKSCGYDGIAIKGKSERLAYLYVQDGKAELRDASHLKLKDTFEMETLIKQEIGKAKRAASVFGIGPAGENQVRFACIVGDEGHVAAHNGVGAVMGSKNLKAIAVARGTAKTSVRDQAKVDALVTSLTEKFKKDYHFYTGTSESFGGALKSNKLAIRNLTTTKFPYAEKYINGYQRSHFEKKVAPCFACQSTHCYTMKVTEGPFTGYEGGEPEYEGWAAWGSGIWQADPGAAVVLNNDVDRLGLDNNEAGWMMSWLMECFEKGLLTEKDLGMELKWGDANASREMLRRIAFREGFGDFLAQGLMRAAQKVGGEAAGLGVYGMQGNTLRTHNFHSKWFEMFDTIVSNTGTMESNELYLKNNPSYEFPATYDAFSPKDISTLVAKSKGIMEFGDSLVLCRFAIGNVNDDILSGLVSGVTGWDFSVKEAFEIGRRTVNLMRVFNLRSGITSEMERPSERLWSVPYEGAGKSIKPYWNEMLSNYYQQMGWDKNGVPLPETLKNLGLEFVLAGKKS